MNDNDLMAPGRGGDGRFAVESRNPPLSETLSRLVLDLGPRRPVDDEDWPELGLDEPEREPSAPYQAR